MRIRRKRHGGYRQIVGHEADRPADEECDAKQRARWLRAAVKKLKSGDFFFLTYSGHGGQVTDITGEEDDKKDETWCMYDMQLIDDELYFELSRFGAGVRVLVFSDSCHSGTLAPRCSRSWSPLVLSARAGAPR